MTSQPGTPRKRLTTGDIAIDGEIKCPVCEMATPLLDPVELGDTVECENCEAELAVYIEVVDE